MAKKKPLAASSETRREKPPRAGEPALGRAASILAFLKAAALLAFIGVSVWGYLRTRTHVERNVAFGRLPPAVILKDRPPWMSDALARKVLAVARPEVAHSAFDHGLLVNTVQMLQTHPDTAPWIRQVKAVRRAYGQAPGDTLEIDCDFRAPVAAVRWMDYYWYVDGDGILLPEQFSAAEIRKALYDPSHHLNLRIIEGVAAAPPESGRKWAGEDLTAGIDMVKFLHGRACADEIERINVANFAGRIDRNEAQLVLITRYQTQVRWGRPVNSKDFVVEVSDAQKLQYLEAIVQQFGRVDANHSAIDLRFEWVTYPSAEASANPGAPQ